MTLKQILSPSTMDVQLFKDQTLGIGSFGKVCRARYGSLPCAAKLIHETLFDPEAVGQIAPEKEHRLPFKRFEQECEVLHNMRHPNVIQYLSAYQDPDTKLPVLLMELMDDNLTHFLNNSSQQIPFHIQVNFCHDISLALSFLHANKVVHRDLSSNNVLLISNIRAKVTDFGMATQHVNEQATQFSHTMCPGTDAYMPPEAVEAKPVYTEKIDCFSFGVLVIQILTQLFPAPGNRQEVMENHPGLRKGRKVMVTVPEVERRENHLVLIDPNHPLLAVALDCLQDLESDRPSAQHICKRVAALKESAEYTESNKEADKYMKVEPLQGEKQGVGGSPSHNVKEREDLIKVEQQENLRLNELIRLKDDTIADQEKEIEELKKQLAATATDKGTRITQQQEEQSLQTKKAEPKREYPNYLTSEDIDQQLGKLPEPLIEKAQKSSQGKNHPFDKRLYVNVRHSRADTPPKKPGSPCQKHPGPTPVDLTFLRIQEQCKTLMLYWYQPWLSREEAISYLLDKDPGWFVIRDSTTVTGGYALTVRLSRSHVRKRRNLPLAAPVTEDMLATHFLIQPDSEGVRLQGWSKKAFKSLPEFIAHHTVKKLCLPCKLVLPQFGSGGASQVRRRPAGMKQALQSGADIPSNGSERLDIKDNITEQTKVPQYTRPISPIVSAGTPTESSSRTGEDVYMTPATNQDALYVQLSEIRINFFKRDSLKLTKQLGAGQFGGVHQGEWAAPRSERKVNVAAKMRSSHFFQTPSCSNGVRKTKPLILRQPH